MRLASAWTSGEFDFDVFLRPPGGSNGRSPRRILDTAPLGPPTMLPRACPHVFRVYTSCIHKLLPLVLVASAPAKCVHRVGGGPVSQFTAAHGNEISFKMKAGISSTI